ncbi:MAG: VOC family protein [Actinobacteria bacterium]|nr:MAG: VOC family protein [Actinomycetota bacterium]
MGPGTLGRSDGRPDLEEDALGNPITWFEIIGPDPEKTAAFYAELFGWHTDAVEGGYITLDTHAGRGMNGGFTTPQGQAANRSIFYAEAADLQPLLDKAGSLGSPVSAGDNPPIDWVEIGCAEPEKAWDFYRDLFGWTIEGDMSGEDGAPVHGSFDTGAPVGARGGIGSSPDGEARVDIYAAVDDLAKYLERAAGLGGSIVMPAMKVDEETEIAMFTDPRGGTFGLYGSAH